MCTADRRGAGDIHDSSEGLVAETLAFGSPDSVARHIEYMRSIGVGQIVGWMNLGGLPQDKIRRSMELFAREVMPRFR
jgi:alkanesulfonate monooxygenase SsuD/methylene tetrahydromethanopterin reductase-like flavin-dependent oxidoreductase (luciferase family)